MNRPNDLALRIARASVESAQAVDRESPEALTVAVSVALLEAARSATVPAHWAIASTLLGTDGGSSSSLRGTKGPVERTCQANSYLVHALLRDDAYRTAFHPGQLVVPTALALAETVNASSQVTRGAIAVGYECVCRLADILLPMAATRGWRITALLAAPAAAATTVSILSPMDIDRLAAALRIAASIMGGSLHTVRAGADWRTQGALLLPAGLSAGRLAASGVETTIGAFEAPFGPLDQFADGTENADIDGMPTITGLTFKAHSAPMYAQGALDACRQLPQDLASRAREVRLHLSPFAAAYGGGQGPVGAAANTSGLIRARLSELYGALAMESVSVDVSPDTSLQDLDARIEVILEDGSSVSATSGKSTTEGNVDSLIRRYDRHAGADGKALIDSIGKMAVGVPIADIVESWNRVGEAWVDDQKGKDDR